MTDKDSKLIYEAYNSKKDEVVEENLDIIDALTNLTQQSEEEEHSDEDAENCPMSDEEHDSEEEHDAEEDQEIGDDAKQISKHLESLVFELQRLNDSIGLYVRGKRPASFVSGPEQQQ